MSLSLFLLGVLQASLDGQPITEFYSSKVRALLAYLAVEAEPHPRSVLAALLWPEWDDRAALGNLRFSLSKLRQAIKDQDALPPFLLISRDTIQLNSAADVSVDVHLFQQELHASQWESVDVDGQSESAVRAVLEHLGAAMKLYRGRFLDGFFLSDSAEFEQWALIKREELEREACWALHGLTALYCRLGDYATAERYVRQLLDRDRWDELANRRLMSMLLQRGQRNAALRHYTAYQEELAKELGCEPEDETQALYAQIRDGALVQPPPPRKEGGTEMRRGRGIEPSVSRLAQESARSLLSEAQGSFRFVAREQELARLGTLLERALTGQGGVALIAGEAGSGKTALLDEFARRACLVHRDLIAAPGSCNAYAGAGDPYLPFREMLQTLAGDVEGKRAGGTLSLDQARRAWEALPAVGAALVEHGPGLIDTFVSGEALLRRIEGFPALLGAGRWLPQLQDLVRRARERGAPSAGPATPTPGPGWGLTPQPDLFAQVTQVLHAVSTARPLLLAVDDLQWAGAGTAALLFHLGRRLAGSRILLVCAYRPEALAPRSGFGAGASEDIATVALDPQSGLGAGVAAILQELCREWGDVVIDLDRADGRAFVEAYVDSEPNRLGTAFRQALYDHTGGNPLFTVELLRSFERAGALAQDEAGQWIEAAEPDWERCPPRVEAVIVGHLDGLADEDRALLQAASVQGEQFVAEVAARVLGCDEEAIAHRLSGPLRTQQRLVEALSLERLVRRGQTPSESPGQRLSTYRFRHALLQRSAYRSLDPVERAQLHEATGRSLEAVLAAGEERRQALSPELARHYEAASLPMEAARHRLEAGQWAMRLVASDEAIAHLERGLALLEGVPASGERLRLELALCLALVYPAVLRGGWRAPSYTRTLAHLSDLTQRPELRGDPHRVAALAVLALLCVWSADPERGCRVGEQLLALAEDGDRQSLMLAHWALGHGHWLRGHLVAGREHLEQVLAFYDPEAGRPLLPSLAQDPGVVGRALLGWVLWLLGHPDQSRAELRQALAQAESAAQPSSAALAHALVGCAHLLLGRDVATALSHAHALELLGEAGRSFGPWAATFAAQDGQPGAAGPERTHEPDFFGALAQVEKAESSLEALGSGLGQAAQLLILARLCGRAGQAQRGLEAMDRAQAWIERTGVRVLEAEVWRMRGELLLADDGPRTTDNREPASSGAGDPSASWESEACFHRALDLARDQQARWLELRAAVSLARLWQVQGRRDEARELLAGIYGWFSEGFDGVDLVEARAVLDELG